MRGSSGVVGQRAIVSGVDPGEVVELSALGARLAAAPARDEGRDHVMRAHALALARDRLDMVDEGDEVGLEAGLLGEFAQRRLAQAFRRLRRRRRAANRRPASGARARRAISDAAVAEHRDRGGQDRPRRDRADQSRAGLRHAGRR